MSLARVLVVAVIVILVLAGASPATCVADEMAPAHGFLGDFAVTYYWVAAEDGRFAGLDRDQPLRDRDGGEIARVSAAFRHELDREGTGRLADGRVVNVATRVDGQWRYVLLDGGSGLGAWGSRLVPFVSAAADPRRVPTGAVLYLPALAGLALPDGRTHDGYLVVDDAGSAIVRDRLDVFIADLAHLVRFESRLPSHGRTAVFLVDDAWAACTLAERAP